MTCIERAAVPLARCSAVISNLKYELARMSCILFLPVPLSFQTLSTSNVQLSRWPAAQHIENLKHEHTFPSLRLEQPRAVRPPA